MLPPFTQNDSLLYKMLLLKQLWIIVILSAREHSLRSTLNAANKTQNNTTHPFVSRVRSIYCLASSCTLRQVQHTSQLLFVAMQRNQTKQQQQFAKRYLLLRFPLTKARIAPCTVPTRGAHGIIFARRYCTRQTRPSHLTNQFGAPYIMARAWSYALVCVSLPSCSLY